MDLGKVVEYDSDGPELWSFPAPGAWSANPLPNGNVLITDRLGVREVTRRGDSVWSWSKADTPEYKFASLQNAYRLKNGDTVINNWVNEWTKNGDNAPGSAQAIEVIPDKKVVWALREWGRRLTSAPRRPSSFWTRERRLGGCALRGYSLALGLWRRRQVAGGELGDVEQLGGVVRRA